MKNKISVIIAVIAIGSCIILGYFMYMERNENKNYKSQYEQLEQKVSKLEENKNLEEVSKSEENKNTEAITKNEIDTFKTYQQNYQNGFNDLIKNNNLAYYSFFDEEDLCGIREVYINSEAKVTLVIDKNTDLSKKYGTNYTVTENASQIYICSVGQGSLKDIVVIKNDGTASIISGSELSNSIIKEQQVENAKNIVNVIQYQSTDEMGLGANEYAFIDIDGNIIK